MSSTTVRSRGLRGPSSSAAPGERAASINQPSLTGRRWVGERTCRCAPGRRGGRGVKGPPGPSSERTCSRPPHPFHLHPVGGGERGSGNSPASVTTSWKGGARWGSLRRWERAPPASLLLEEGLPFAARGGSGGPGMGRGMGWGRMSGLDPRVGYAPVQRRDFPPRIAENGAPRRSPPELLVAGTTLPGLPRLDGETPGPGAPLPRPSR